MPINYHNESLGTEWLKNATRIWGIPLHPRGEVDVMTFIMEASNRDELRRRLSSIYRQVGFDIIFLCVFIYNLSISIRMLRGRPRAVSSWCCLISSITGISWVACIFWAIFLPGANCRIAIWHFAIGQTISTMCNSTIILQKAYIALFHRRWVKLTGVLFMLPQLSIFFITWSFCPVTVEANRGCTFHYPSFYPWIWLAIVAPSNLFFSLIFCRVAYRQYRMFGSKAWRRLAREGVQTMLLVMVCNIFCGLMVAFDMFGAFSEMAFPTDWLITSAILVQHCQNMRRTKQQAYDSGTSRTFQLSAVSIVSLSKLGFQKPNIQGAELLKLNADTGFCLSLPTVFHRNVVFTTCSNRGRDDDLRSLWRVIPLNSLTIIGHSVDILKKRDESNVSDSPYVQIRNLQNGLCLTFRSKERTIMTDECEFSTDGEPIHSQLFRFYQPTDKTHGESKLISAESDDSDNNNYDCLRSGRSYHDDIAMANNFSFLSAIMERCDHDQRWQYIQRRPVHAVASA
ncbi:hypothetical protein BDF19DRAFT_468063 [Syncephalis fuscata]|nr:hypothetical protein BDF19DRAFT_468063 [Syncephalis fuscata]